MSRIRTIKPEFWTSEQVVECSQGARLLFIGLWNFCDDGGVHPASEKRLKMEVFPADDEDSTSIRRMIGELLSNNLIIEYSIKNQMFWRVLGWKHQKLDKPSYKYPLENGVIPKDKNHFVEIVSTTIRRPFDDRSPPESSLVESSRVEKNSTREEVLPLRVGNTTGGGGE